MRVLDDAQEGDLHAMSKETDVKNDVGLGDETGSIKEGITNSVHRVREHGKDAIEGEVLVDEEEEIAPVPSKVLDDAIGITLGPNGEPAEESTKDVAADGEKVELLGCLEEVQAKQDVAGNVIVEHKIDKHPPAKPCVECSTVLGRVVLAFLEGEFGDVKEWTFERATGRSDALVEVGEELAVGLLVEQDTEAAVVAKAPEEEPSDVEPRGEGQEKKDHVEEASPLDPVGSCQRSKVETKVYGVWRHRHHKPKVTGSADEDVWIDRQSLGRRKFVFFVFSFFFFFRLFLLLSFLSRRRRRGG
mmetsp:Transcript_17231/g.28499  ORF Transcript_17231/g.28499 Transcript_17231/m.28499 type:complete len:302 (+) Transcript_17231:1087-1992(+)